MSGQVAGGGVGVVRGSGVGSGVGVGLGSGVGVGVGVGLGSGVGCPPVGSRGVFAAFVDPPPPAAITPPATAAAAPAPTRIFLLEPDELACRPGGGRST